jgi:undecaprenyl-diphosphatase
MNWIEALILGIIQGLTEFLPISSSGHLELGKVLLDIEQKQNLTFSIVVHGGTVLSTIVVFQKDIATIIRDIFRFHWNESVAFACKIGVSMIPVLIVGMLFKEEIESLFCGNLLLVGCMLLVTALLLAFTYFARQTDKTISWIDSFIIGIAQAIAVIPGISRSGATISTGILLKNQREAIARFSFLMVLIPIIGANAKDLFSAGSNQLTADITPLAVGFTAAFVSGLLACKWMLSLVKKGRLIFFAGYCLIVGLIAIIAAN